MAFPSIAHIASLLPCSRHCLTTLLGRHSTYSASLPVWGRQCNFHFFSHRLIHHHLRTLHRHWDTVTHCLICQVFLWNCVAKLLDGKAFPSYMSAKLTSFEQCQNLSLTEHCHVAIVVLSEWVDKQRKLNLRGMMHKKLLGWPWSFYLKQMSLILCQMGSSSLLWCFQVIFCIIVMQSTWLLFCCGNPCINHSLLIHKFKYTALAKQ